MVKTRFFLLYFLLFLLLKGCATPINPHFEPPVVTLSTFRVLPQQNITPTFEIGLNILNPNRDPLDLKGLYYTVTIEGFKVLAGVSNDLPRVEPYAQAEVVLLANVDLISGIKFFSALVNEPREVFSYSFNAKLDPGGFNPKILIQEKGEIDLSPRR